MDNAATMQQAYDLLNKGDVDGFGALVADGFVEHETMPGLSPTKDGVLELFRGYLASFPDFHMDVQEILPCGDKAVARVTVNGTQDGEFMGLPPSGRSVSVPLIDIMRFDDAGLVCEHWGVVDMLSLLQQVGVIPDGLPE